MDVPVVRLPVGHRDVERLHLLHDVGIVAGRVGRARRELPHVRRVDHVENALFAAADDPRRRAGQQHGAAGAEIEVELVEEREVAGREPVLDDEILTFELQFDEAVAVVLATLVRVEGPVAGHQIDIAVRVGRRRLPGLPDAAVRYRSASDSRTRAARAFVRRSRTARRGCRLRRTPT